MQRRINNLVGYTLNAKDGELGKVDEFYFDDSTWSIRYLAVKSGNWFSERKVLIPHIALGVTDWESRTFHVNLTIEQIRNKTVSRRHEITLFSQYELPNCWGDGFYAGPIETVPAHPIMDKNTMTNGNYYIQQHYRNKYLLSTKKIKGYRIQANDGEIGHVEDYLLDDKKWNLCSLIVDTHVWYLLPGKKVLIQPYWINHIDCNESRAYVNLSEKSIKNSPMFKPFETASID
ncbi:MAG: PRC-barrel domain-containing protein [Ignavibacteriaceae bacterium]|jgi:sporulation protein YlmC with PRC-barrel domain